MTADAVPSSRTRTATLVVLIVSQLLYVLSLLPWLVMAGLSVMAFDAPGSTQQWEPWAFVAAIWSYPAWLTLFALAAWLLFLKRRHVGATVVALVPLLPGLALLGWMTLASVTTAP